MIQRTTGLFVYWIPIQQLDCLHPHTKSTISSIRLRTYLGRYYCLADHKHLCWTWWSSHCHRTTLTLRKHLKTSSKCLTVVHTWMNDNGISRLCWRKYFVNIARQGTDTFDPFFIRQRLSSNAAIKGCIILDLYLLSLEHMYDIYKTINTVPGEKEGRRVNQTLSTVQFGSRDVYFLVQTTLKCWMSFDKCISMNANYINYNVV